MHKSSAGVETGWDVFLKWRLVNDQPPCPLAHIHEHAILGLNSRLDALQAAALLVKEDAFDAEVEMRRAHAHRYDQALAGALNTPFIAPGRYSSYAQYTVTLPDAASRDEFVDFLGERGVPTALHYPRPVHTLSAEQVRLKVM